MTHREAKCRAEVRRGARVANAYWTASGRWDVGDLIEFEMAELRWRPEGRVLVNLCDFPVQVGKVRLIAGGFMLWRAAEEYS